MAGPAVKSCGGHSCIWIVGTLCPVDVAILVFFFNSLCICGHLFGARNDQPRTERSRSYSHSFLVPECTGCAWGLGPNLKAGSPFAFPFCPLNAPVPCPPACAAAAPACFAQAVSLEQWGFSQMKAIYP